MHDKIKDNLQIQFIKPCRSPYEQHHLLTPKYIYEIARSRKIVQINLDNCSIQRMEQLSENATIEDVKKVGLLPLVHILCQAPLISLGCIGSNEMPERRITSAYAAYERFCRKFWPGHKNDPMATYRTVNPDNNEQKINFKELSDAARCTYGPAYVAMLQIKNIKLTYSDKSPYDQFVIYLHSMINMLDFISAFELEIAKYAFWKLSMPEINKLPENIKQRRSDINENFCTVKRNLNKCKELAFGAAMDIHWLTGANQSEDLDQSIEIEGVKLSLDNWVGTNDIKLYRICNDIHWYQHEGSSLKQIAVTREDYLCSLPYWQYVDNLSHEIMNHRKRSGYSDINNLLNKIDSSVIHIEEEIVRTTRI